MGKYGIIKKTCEKGGAAFMKIRTKLAIAFLTITVVPITLIYMAIIGLNNYQARVFSETYGVSEDVDLFSGASIRVFSHLTESIQKEIDKVLESDTGKFSNETYLADLNGRLSMKHSFLVVRKAEDLLFVGDTATVEELKQEFFGYEDAAAPSSWRNFLDKDTEHLLKIREFTFPDRDDGGIYLVTNVMDMVPEAKSMIFEMLVTSVMILFITGAVLTVWVYQSILRPIGKLQEATKKIRDGNLDFTLEVEDDDEIGQLCQNFEEMRIRLKESTEEKVQYDKESKELISNISHDLKTPITAIKGYVEGIMDGVASSPEKLDKYIRTIYHKANDMDRLINELTFYSKIDTNRIPYTFNKINVKDYFDDCMEEVYTTLLSKNMTLTYKNYCDDDVKVIVDPDQLKRVINNIITNAIKYTDKEYGQIDINIYDNDAEVKVSISDNGRGIDSESLPHIFDRMYRADSARQSRGGSGLGLAICKKIVEEHGGNIYATSQLGVGTTIVFTLKKYIPKVEEIEGDTSDASGEQQANVKKDTQKKDDQRKDNQKKDGQRKGSLQIINSLKKRRDTDE